MQSVESQTDRSVVRRTLLAAALGAALGLQGWRLSVALNVPWFGAIWVWLGHLFLGISVGITAGITSWWKRGIGLGLAFGLASGFGGLAVGMKWIPYAVAAIVASLVSGVLVALIADAVYPVVCVPENRKRKESPEPGAQFRRAPSLAMQSATGRRLASKKALLEGLEQERALRRRPSIGKAAEEHVIWGELLELELQDIDERLEEICGGTNDPPKAV